MTEFRDALDRMLAEAMEQYESDPGRYFMNSSPPQLPAPALTVTRHTGYVRVSLDQLVDAGVLGDEEARAQGWTPPPPPSRRDRLRWRWQAWRERTGRKIGDWVAGVDLSERDDDW